MGAMRISLPVPVSQLRRHSILIFAISILTISSFVLYFRPFSEKYVPMHKLFSTVQSKPGTGCQKVSNDRLVEIKSSYELSLSIFRADTGEELDEDAELGEGSEVCIVVAVPQERAPSYKEKPVYGKGPDDVHLFLKGGSSLVDFAPLSTMAGQNPELQSYYEVCSQSEDQYRCWEDFYEQNALEKTTILYSATQIMQTADIYEVQADIQYFRYNWAEQWIDNQSINATEYNTGFREQWASRADRTAEYSIWTPNPWKSVSKDKMFPALLTIHQAERPRAGQSPLQRPFCDSRITAAKGKWYSDESDRTQNHPREMFDEFGFTWDGDDCQFDWYNSQDILDCFQDSSIHLFGDSNIRRLAKSIASGNTFCSNFSAVCQQYDRDLPYDVLRVNENNELVRQAIEPTSIWDDHLFGAPRRFEFGYNTIMDHIFVRSLAYHFIDWRNTFYASADLPVINSSELYDPNRRLFKAHTFELKEDLRHGAVARPPSNLAQPDLVLVGAPMWDTLGATRVQDFERAATAYAEALLEAYKGTQVVLILTQGFCSVNVTGLDARSSNLRIRWYTEIFVDAFRSAVEDGRAIIVDPYLMTGRPDAMQIRGTTNHMRYAEVRLLTQMLMNSVCEREDGPGTRSKARMRKTFSRSHMPDIV